VKPVGPIDSTITGLPLRLGRLSLPRALSGGLAMAGLAAAYVLLEWVSSIHEYKGVPITPWNPGLGLALACMVLGGARYAVALFVGVVISEIAVLHSQLAWTVILGIAAIIAAVYGGVAQLARSNLRLDAGLNRLRDIVMLLLSGAAGAVLVALFVCLLLLADDDLDLGDVLVAAGPLVIGDVIGIAVITPVALRLALRPPPLLDHVSLQALMELVLFTAVVTAALWLILGAAGPGGTKLFYLLFLPVVIAAVRHGVDGACIGLAVTQLGLIAMLHRYGYDADAFTAFQLLMLVLSATGLIVGVVVTERQHADATVRAVELQLKAKEAEAAQAARLNLVSGTAAALAHEINQPMTAARALARSVQQLLRAPDADRARVDTNLGELIAQIDHAGGVVRRMRDFLRRGRPHNSTIDVGDLLADALALAGPEARAKDIGVTIDVAVDVPPIHGDAVQLQQVVLNLVRNAAEAIAGARVANGRIAISARRSGASAPVEIAVADNGPGIDAEIAARLFHPLTTSKVDGLGLGLSISASIVEAHGGRIWLEKGAPGATEFRFSLPVQAG
jgi:two-component system sensor kinase FixL